MARKYRGEREKFPQNSEKNFSHIRTVTPRLKNIERKTLKSQQDSPACIIIYCKFSIVMVQELIGNGRIDEKTTTMTLFIDMFLRLAYKMAFNRFACRILQKVFSNSR